MLSFSNTRCIDGRLFRHEALHDDPYFEMDIGACPECEGKGCAQLHREAAEKAAGGRIVTDFWAKPIPPRNFDWCAYRDNDEPDDDGHMMQGFGPTEQDAIDDLIQQIMLIRLTHTNARS
jgi:hypothetical protein